MLPWDSDKELISYKPSITDPHPQGIFYKCHLNLVWQCLYDPMVDEVGSDSLINVSVDNVDGVQHQFLVELLVSTQYGHRGAMSRRIKHRT